MRKGNHVISIPRNEKPYANQDLNSWKLITHQSLLYKFDKSQYTQYKETIFYLCQKGRVYYITYQGTKFCF